MFKNIKHNNARSLKFRLRNDRYYDFMLYRGECTGSNGKNCVVADIKPYNMSDGKVVSETEWVDAKNEGIVLKNIGYTGVDNGLIQFRRDKVSNSQFLKIFTESEYIVDDSKSFYMFPVSGNSNQYKYFYELKDDSNGGYISLNGGFLQGFYKLHGYEYQTLPNFIEDEWNFEFVLRRKDYEVHHRTLNHTHPENNGIFFYMGTRAENKFWRLYKIKNDISDLYDSVNHHDGYFEEGAPDLSNVINTDYFLEKEVEIEDEPKVGYNSRCNCTNHQYVNEVYSDDSYFDFNVGGNCKIDDYFSDAYTGNYHVSEDCDSAGYSLGNEYYERDISLTDVLLTTDNGYDINKRGYYEIKTDNKFVTFDHTKDGFTTKTFDPENPYVIFEGRKDWDNPNYFVLMNHTSTGYTTKTIEKYLEENTEEYDVYKDIRNNSFGIKINEDGSIEYRYGITDCEDDNKYKLESEVSKPNLIPMGEWVTVNIRIFIINLSNEKCPSNIGKRKMKMYIYVNGNLVLVSKELPEFRFRELDDVKEKQETVPFNISLGGGTQGLADGIWLNYYEKPDYRFPLERDFCGTFIGDIKSFKFYNCFLDYNSINDNVFRG